MLNFLWPTFIVISFIYGILFGNVEKINQSIFDSAKNTVEMCITLIGSICLWSGIIEIAKKTTIIHKLTKLLNPIIMFLFPEISKKDIVYQDISMNIIANILGLGNAATPLGIRAMKKMQENSKDKERLNNSMVMFIILNTASLQLIPTTVIAIRSSMGSKSPTTIILPVWIATITALSIGVLSTKILIKKF